MSFVESKKLDATRLLKFPTPPSPLINTNRNLMQYKIKTLNPIEIRHADFNRYIEQTEENYLVIKMKQKHKIHQRAVARPWY